MGKAEFGTAKYLSNKMKAKGLQKLRFYCQVCQKQCRDENGFKSHIRSPFHMKNISKVSSTDIDRYTEQFEQDFLRLLRLSHGEKQIGVNKFYNEFIQDKHHIHMNATRFSSLTKFIQYLSKEGKVKVTGLDSLADEEIDPSQLVISYVDKSQQNLLRKARLKELDENQESEQHMKSKLLQRQIELAREEDIAEEEPVARMELPKGGIRVNLKDTMKKVGGSSKKTKTMRGKVHKNVFM
ncbi:hypothetical protein HG537_0G02360 [Torulaspora globosa]|uniref:C2H2-type domain-containing protein n=1 Tax=Torulaspora globosa TaxID=48254 RepID=A0A7H9HZR3_9SACH|nr:hypothetical protein HG537_0G02360 [Torulaspora sp. CBS 2947]